jgi:hypothetical protein
MVAGLFAPFPLHDLPASEIDHLVVMCAAKVGTYGCAIIGGNGNCGVLEIHGVSPFSTAQG